MNGTLQQHIAGLPTVDVHCHPFVALSHLDPADLLHALAFPGGDARFLSAGGIEESDAVRGEILQLRQNTLYMRYALGELGRFFGVEPDIAAIAAARNQVATDFGAHTQSLYSACGLTTLVTDFGYPQPSVDLTQFRKMVSVEVVPIFRIEPLIAQLLNEADGWAEFKRRFDETVAHSLEQEGYRGLKSVIAYRTGLEISPLSRSADQGAKALEAIRRGTGGNATKQLRDHLLCRALELCIEFQVPMQIHTGMGDHEVQLVQCRPALLMDLLRSPIFRSCQVLLVHAGYPYHVEAGYMANMLPRVYCDVSEGIPFAGQAARRILAEVLEMAPLNKVCFGTDGFTLPETNYVGVQLGKRALGQVLESLVTDEFLKPTEAFVAAEWILAENARRLYGLK